MLHSSVSGTATNAFINLANSAGPATRRLLCGGSRLPPVFRTSNDATLTREELANPEVFAAATQRIRGYDPTYTFDRTAHIRIERLMGIGRPLRIILDRMFPGWEDSTEVTLLAERKSLAYLAASLVLLLLFLLLRLAIRWYAETRLLVRTPRVREQVQRAAKAFLKIP